MKVWHFSEMAYPQSWDKAYEMGTFRVEVPNQFYDPKLGATIVTTMSFSSAMSWASTLC